MLPPVLSMKRPRRNTIGGGDEQGGHCCPRCCRCRGPRQNAISGGDEQGSSLLPSVLSMKKTSPERRRGWR